jgi:hypothetical protein
MSGSDLQKIVDKVIEAHGGASRWRKLEAVEAVISVRGFLFKTKRRPILNRIRIRASTREPKFTFYDYPRAGRNSEFIGNEEVRITDADHQVLVNRLQPRAAIRQIRRLLYWDALDFTYFGGYATWNYLVTPFLFMRDDLDFERLEPVSAESEYSLQLKVSFPRDFPTHCKTQIFYFDRHYLLRRLDYTAEVVSRWARAAHICENYQDFDGLRFPAKRRVLPLLIGNKPLAGPVIVAIDIHELNLLSSAGNASRPSHQPGSV